MGSIKAANSKHGFTLLELLLVLAIIGTLATIATPSFVKHRESARAARAVSEIKILESEILSYFIDRGEYPDSLDVIGRGTFRDPWGNPYQYLKIAGSSMKGIGKLRKDHSMVPVNTDYDLYSRGKDGESQAPFSAQMSQDDIVRCGNGSYIGLVSNY